MFQQIKNETEISSRVLKTFKEKQWTYWNRKNKIIHIKAPLMDLTAIRYNQGENTWKGIQIRRKDSE